MHPTEGSMEITHMYDPTELIMCNLTPHMHAVNTTKETGHICACV